MRALSLSGKKIIWLVLGSMKINSDIIKTAKKDIWKMKIQIASLNKHDIITLPILSNILQSKQKSNWM